MQYGNIILGWQIFEIGGPGDRFLKPAHVTDISKIKLRSSLGLVFCETKSITKYKWLRHYDKFVWDMLKIMGTLLWRVWQCRMLVSLSHVTECKFRTSGDALCRDFEKKQIRVTVWDSIWQNFENCTYCSSEFHVTKFWISTSANYTILREYLCLNLETIVTSTSRSDKSFPVSLSVG